MIDYFDKLSTDFDTLIIYKDKKMKNGFNEDGAACKHSITFSGLTSSLNRKYLEKSLKILAITYYNHIRKKLSMKTGTMSPKLLGCTMHS